MTKEELKNKKGMALEESNAPQTPSESVMTVNKRESATVTTKKPRKERMRKEKTKNKVVQAKLFDEDYEKFIQINEARGMSTSAVVSMLITDYIRKNCDIIDIK